MALRVPKAELPAELRESLIRQLGTVPEPVEVTYSNPEVAMSSQEFSAKVATWDAADAPRLASSWRTAGSPASTWSGTRES